VGIWNQQRAVFEKRRSSPQSIDLLGLIAIGHDEVTHLTHFGTILIDFFWPTSQIRNCGIGQNCVAGVVNFSERCLLGLGIATSCPIMYSIVSHTYTHVFGLLPNLLTPVDNIKSTVRGDTGISKNPFFKGFNASLNFG
jgi:hypothetical protein